MWSPVSLARCGSVSAKILMHEMMKSAPSASVPSAGPAAGSASAGVLRMPELVAQSIGLVGVSGGVGMLIPAVFATAGPHTWLAYVFATITLVFVSWSIMFFSRQTASQGALYTYAAWGLGGHGGLVCAACLLIAYALGGAGILLGAANALAAFLNKVGWSVDMASIPVALALTGSLALLGWFLTSRDVLMSTRVTMAVELVTIVLISLIVWGLLTLGGTVLVDRSQLSLQDVSFQQLQPGIVLAFFSFVGFESATVLGREARRPLKAVPVAVMISVLVPAGLFVLSSYAMVATFSSATDLARLEAPLSSMADRLGWGRAGVFLELGVALSFFVAFLSSLNAAARIAFALAHDGHLPCALGRLHPRHQTPHVAVGWNIALSLALSGVLIGTCGVSLVDAYGWLSTVATYGYLLAYLLVALSAPLYLLGQRRLGVRSVLWTLGAVGMLSIPLIGSVSPAPPGVYGTLPYVFVTLLALMLVVLFRGGPTRRTR